MGGGAGATGGAGGSQGGGGGALDAGQTRSILLVRRLTAFLPDASLSYDVDFGSLGATAWVETSSGAWQSRSSRVLDAGLAIIDDVPVGRSYVTYYRSVLDTQAPFIDLSNVIVGRPDARPVEGSTRVSLSSSGLEAWNVNSYLTIASVGAGVFIESVFAGSTAIAMGATSGTDTVDWATYGLNAVNADAGDTLILTQLSVRAFDGGLPYRTATRVATVSASVRDRVASTIAAPFTVVAQSQKRAVDWRTNDWAALAPAVAPGATVEQLGYAIRALPAGVDAGVLTATPAMLFISATGGAPSVLGEAIYGRPYPAAWPLVSEHGAYFTVPVSVGAANGTLSVRCVSTDVLSAAPSPSSPSLGAPRGLHVNGQEADAPLALVGTSPELSWDAPSLGLAEGYEVRLWRASPLGASLRLELVGSVLTQNRTVRLPPGSLASGSSYVFEVVASSGIHPERPYLNTLPFRACSHVSAPISP